MHVLLLKASGPRQACLRTRPDYPRMPFASQSVIIIEAVAGRTTMDSETQIREEISHSNYLLQTVFAGRLACVHRISVHSLVAFVGDSV